jgi:hypothetical protein
MQELEHTIAPRGCVHNRLAAAELQKNKRHLKRSPIVSPRAASRRHFRYRSTSSVTHFTASSPSAARTSDVARVRRCGQAYMRSFRQAYMVSTSGSRGQAANAASLSDGPRARAPSSRAETRTRGVVAPEVRRRLRLRSSSSPSRSHSPGRRRCPRDPAPCRSTRGRWSAGRRRGRARQLYVPLVAAVFPVEFQRRVGRSRPTPS